MKDLGAPVSYLALETGVRVFDTSGAQIGRVEHVLAAEAQDIFEGILIDARGRAGGWRYADAEQIESLHERGVVLSVGAGALHDPEPGPAALGVDPADTAQDPLRDRLRRVWDYVSGKY